MLRKLPVSILVAIQILILTFTSVQARPPEYKEQDVNNGGSVQGRILFKGAVPAPIKIDLKLKKNPEFCLENAKPNDQGELLLQHVEVEDGGLKDAVIFIEDIKQGKPWGKSSLVIDFKDCKSYPKVAVMHKPLKFETKGLVVVKNHDEGVLHNPKGFSIGDTTRRFFFKKWLLNQGTQIDATKSLKRLKKGRDTHFYIECEQHLWMSVSSRVVWNPYHAVSDDEGSFNIDRIPPGKYRMVIWHPYVGEKSMEIKIEPRKNIDLNITLP